MKTLYTTEAVVEGGRAIYMRPISAAQTFAEVIMQRLQPAK
jgi:hypothetical protein